MEVAPFLKEGKYIQIGKDFKVSNYYMILKKPVIYINNGDVLIKLDWDWVMIDFNSQSNTKLSDNGILVSSFKKIKWDILSKENMHPESTPDITYLKDSINLKFMFVPLNSFSYIELNLKILLKFLEEDRNRESFLSLPLSTAIILNIDYKNSLPDFNKVCDFLPKHTELELSSEALQLTENIIKFTAINQSTDKSNLTLHIITWIWRWK